MLRGPRGADIQTPHRKAERPRERARLPQLPAFITPRRARPRHRITPRSPARGLAALAVDVASLLPRVHQSVLLWYDADDPRLADRRRVANWLTQGRSTQHP
jgi:hypothetical protein